MLSDTMPSGALRIGLVSHTNAAWTEPYASYIQEHGHTLRIYSFSRDPLPGFDVVHLVQREQPVTGILGWIQRSRRLRRHLLDFSPHVVFAPYISSNGMATSLAWNGPTVVSARGGDILRQAGYLPAGPLNRYLVRWVCSRAQAVHSVSAQLTAQLKACGVPGGKIRTFPLGVALDQFRPAEKAPADFGPGNIVCTRRQEGVYDNATLVTALSRLQQQDIPFRATLVGGGPLLDQLRHQVRDLGLTEQVAIPGEASPSQILRLLRQADIYVSTSTSDGTSSSLLEAMACGVFPVVSNITANRAWIEPPDNGALFKPGDAKELSHRLAAALKHPALRLSAGRLNRSLMERSADRDKLTARLLEMLLEAATTG